MAAIKGKGNHSTEVALARLFRAQGITGWRRNAKVFGRPDFVFLASRMALFVDGCFWHGCPVHFVKPVGNAEFWETKISRNQARDRLVNLELRKRGWTVLRIWEHSVKVKAGHKQLLAKVKGSLARSAQKMNR